MYKYIFIKPTQMLHHKKPKQLYQEGKFKTNKSTGIALYDTNERPDFTKRV